MIINLNIKTHINAKIMWLENCQQTNFNFTGLQSFCLNLYTQGVNEKKYASKSTSRCRRMYTEAKKQPAIDLMDKERIDFRHLNRGTRVRNKLKTE